jgi:hypothetical protein
MTAGAALLIAALAGCSTGSTGHTSPKATPARSSAAAPSTHLTFGGTYTWPDGVKVSVTGARVFTDFNTADGESPAPGATDFRVTLRVTNGGKAPVDLGGLSVIVQGATNGGAAASGTFERGSAPLEGQLAPGVTAAKNDDESLAKQYGRRVVVRMQRVSYDPSGAMWPEFTGTVTG